MSARAHACVCVCVKGVFDGKMIEGLERGGGRALLLADILRGV